MIFQTKIIAFLIMNVKNHLKDKSFEEIKEYYDKNANPEAVAALNISSDSNIGLMVRTASNFGMREVNIIGRRRYDRRTAVGMYNYIPVNRYKAVKGYHSEDFDIDRIIEILSELGQKYTIVYIEQGGAKLPGFFDDKQPEHPFLFVTGNEGVGIPQEVMDSVAGYVVEIPQVGVGRSHNVSIALATVLWEFYRTKL